MNRFDVERERYEARLKALRDMSASLAGEREEGRKEGHKEGHKEGLAEGIDVGELMGRIHLCQKLLKQAQTPKEELEKWSVDDLARLAAELQRQALPPDE